MTSTFEPQDSAAVTSNTSQLPSLPAVVDEEIGLVPPHVAEPIQSGGHRFVSCPKLQWMSDWLYPRYSGRQFAVFGAGCVIFSAGATLLIHARLGTDPLDVFSIGVVKHTHLTIGIVQGTLAAVLLAVWAIWNSRLPIVSPFVTFFGCGSIIDLLLFAGLAEEPTFNTYLIMSSATLLCTAGSALIIMSGIGIRAMDLLALTLQLRFRVPFWAGKGIMEIMLFVSGWLLGGPVGLGSICFFVCVGWGTVPAMLLLENAGMHNHGINTLHDVEEQVK